MLDNLYQQQRIARLDSLFINKTNFSISENFNHVLDHTCTYEEFIGRELEREELSEKLLDSNGPRIIALYGPGGIGKTSLAHWLYSQHKDYFEYVVWISIKDEILDKGGIWTYDIPVLTFDSVMVEIAKQTQQEDLLVISSDSRKNALAYFLRNHRVLIILDNLDTLDSPKDEDKKNKLIGNLYELLGESSRLILTSRHKVEHFGIYPKVLDRLKNTDGISFIKHEAKKQNIELFESILEEDLTKLLEVTGCLPLLMRIAIGQLEDEPLSTVISYLEDAKRYIDGTQVEHPLYQFYRFAYKRSWENLKPESQVIWICMGRFPANIGARLESIKDIVLSIHDMTTDLFNLNLKQLVKRSLIYKLGNIGDERYALHTNTKRFVLGDILKEDMLWD